ncbi:MAG: hypothetical protein ACKVP7_23620 [Hyphomicrobiaceae bacterium]
MRFSAARACLALGLAIGFLAAGLGPQALAADPSCKQFRKIKSQASTRATTITFINASKTIRVISWLDFTGFPKDFAQLAVGQQVTLNTFMTHPWMVATGPGDCLSIVLPQRNGSTVRLTDAGNQVGASNPHGPTPVETCRQQGLVYEGGVCVKPKTATAPKAGEEGGTLKGCPVGTVPVAQTDDCTQAPAGQEGRGNPVQGRSLGGIVRRQADQASPRVASFRENEPITILKNTGVVMNDYAWFQVRSATGVTGFQWGGIMCSNVKIPGIFEVCKP